jgi:predicted permease
VRQLLVVAQTAMALVLLIGSGLMVRSFRQIRNVDPGFVAEGVLTFRVSLPASEYAEAGAVEAFHRRLIDGLRALPGVQAAGGVRDLPLGGAGTGTAHQVEDFPTTAGQLPPMFWYTYATPGYLEAMRMRVVAGRGFEESDMQGTRRNVMVSAALARRLWAGQDVIGKRLRTESDTLGWNTIIGVVDNVRDKGLDEEVSDMVYYPFVGPRGDDEAGERAIRSMTYAVRASNPVGLANAVREQVWALDRNLPIASVSTMTEVLSRSTLRLSFTMIALVVAAAVALLLGAIGLYGVISYIVSHRTQEIGVRMALGARPTEVRRMVVAQGLRLSALGLLIGFVAALGMTRLLQGLLFGTEPTDPATFASVSLVLVAVGLVATYVPAHRASRIDPARSLKVD